MVDVQAVSDQYQNDFDFGEFFAEEIAPRIEFKPDQTYLRDEGWVFENLSAYSVLWMLAQNQRNLDLPLIWDFGDPDNEEVTGENLGDSTLSRSQRFLIVTEGSSDAHVIKKALRLRRPEIADFFYFVDVDAGFPFGGTGSLHRFCEGLARISLLNNTIIIYDNDAAGVAQWRQTLSLRDLPSNIRVMKLPNLPARTLFKTVGPNGESLEEINERAASIEAYLDHKELVNGTRVRWSAYISTLGSYQGEFEQKVAILHNFLKRTNFDGYEFSRIDLVLDAITEVCRDISVRTS